MYPTHERNCIPQACPTFNDVLRHAPFKHVAVLECDGAVAMHFPHLEMARVNVAIRKEAHTSALHVYHMDVHGCRA